MQQYKRYKKKPILMFFPSKHVGTPVVNCHMRQLFQGNGLMVPDEQNSALSEFACNLFE